MVQTWNSLEQIAAATGERCVRTEEFVAGTDEEIRAPTVHVDAAVRGIMHAVDNDDRAGIVSQLGYFRQIRHCAEQVAGGGDSDDLRVFG